MLVCQRLRGGLREVVLWIENFVYDCLFPYRSLVTSGISILLINVEVCTLIAGPFI